MKNEIVERLLKMAPEYPRYPRLKGSVYHDAWIACCKAFAERLAEKAVVVSGWVNDDRSHTFGTEPEDDDTHAALLIDVQPISQAVEVSEIRGYINNPSAWPAFDQRLSDILERIVKYVVRGKA